MKEVVRKVVGRDEGSVRRKFGGRKRNRGRKEEDREKIRSVEKQKGRGRKGEDGKKIMKCEKV